MSDSSSFHGDVEFTRSFSPRPDVSHVLFDFDGTLSLVRQGWPEVMIPMFLEYLPRREGETEMQARQLVTDDIMKLNGKQTIYQMIQLAERIEFRGGQPKEPLWYKHEYLRRLNNQISHRLEGLRTGTLVPEDLIVAGGLKLLAQLKARGLQLYLASGTDEPFVKQEAELLGLSEFFEDRIYGALDNYKDFSKKMVIERIIQDHGIQGSQLLSFGDGYVEIENTKEVGGLAVAVASDEANNGSGNVDQWKRNRLLGVGADVVVPDYQEVEQWLPVILGEVDQPL